MEKKKEIDYYNIGGIIVGVIGLFIYSLPLGILAVFLGWQAKKGDFAIWMGSIVLVLWLINIVIANIMSSSFVWIW